MRLTMPLQSIPSTSFGHRRTRRLRMVAVLSIATLLTACGGGSSFGPPPEPVVPPNTTIVGVLAKGRVAGASVCAYRITDGKQGVQLGSCTTTDTDGNFTIGFQDYAGEAMVQAKGGTYRDEATGASRTLTTLRAIRPGNLLAFNQNTVHITPLTELAVQRATALGSFSIERITQATRDVSQRFGGFDLYDTTPADLMNTPGLSLGFPERAYGLALAGFSGYIANKGNSATLDTVLIDFASKIAANTLGSETTAFRNGITTFLNSAQNGSGLNAATGPGLIALNFGAGAITGQPVTVTESGEKCLIGSTRLGIVGVNAMCWFNLRAGTCNAANLEARTLAVLNTEGWTTDSPSAYTPVNSCRNQRQLYTVDAVSNTIYTSDPF
jgi:hypothetical protein